MISREDFLKVHEEFCQRLVNTTRAKNADYTGASNDPFQNFKTAEVMNICSTETGFLVRLTDKYTRIISLLQPNAKQQVKDESVDDTILDFANYLILLACYRAAKRYDAVNSRDKTYPETTAGECPTSNGYVNQDVGYQEELKVKLTRLDEENLRLKSKFEKDSTFRNTMKR